MDLQVAFEVASQALGVFLVVGGFWFAGWRVWPYVADRDDEERARRHELRLNQNETSMTIASHLAVIAHSLTNPVRITIEPTNGDDA